MDVRSAIADIATKFVAAWNAHDMDAFAALFHEDATFVNRFGKLVRGRAAIHRQHTMIHTSIYRDSVATGAVEHQEELGADAALCFLRFDLKVGAAMPEGPRDLPTRMLAIITRKDGAWRIQAAENVLMVDPLTGAPSKDA